MQREREAGRTVGLASERLKGGFPFWLGKCGLHRGANRTTANNLAERADRADFRGGVQVAATMMRALADLGVFVMVVKQFSRGEMQLAGEQHAHNQGMHPEPEPEFPPASHYAIFAFP